MTQDPDAYLWSSYRQHTNTAGDFQWLDTDPCYQALGDSGGEPAVRYRDFVESAILAGEWELIREPLQRGELTGTKRFVDEVEAIIGRRVENRKRGRPQKDTEK